jgi:hypothetical protein
VERYHIFNQNKILPKYIFFKFSALSYVTFYCGHYNIYKRN